MSSDIALTPHGQGKCGEAILGAEAKIFVAIAV